MESIKISDFEYLMLLLLLAHGTPEEIDAKMINEITKEVLEGRKDTNCKLPGTGGVKYLISKLDDGFVYNVWPWSVYGVQKRVS